MQMAARDRHNRFEGKPEAEGDTLRKSPACRESPRREPLSECNDAKDHNAAIGSAAFLLFSPCLAIAFRVMLVSWKLSSVPQSALPEG